MSIREAEGGEGKKTFGVRSSADKGAQDSAFRVQRKGKVIKRQRGETFGVRRRKTRRDNMIKESALDSFSV